MTQAEKIERFRGLHTATDAFVIPNPWDAGSARMLTKLGFTALATSSSAAAGTLGRRDYGLTREEALESVRRIVEATELPVSADLENGFGDGIDDVIATVQSAAGAGLAGCSIEDAPGAAAPYDLDHATRRIRAAVQAIREMPFQLVLTARAENFLRGRPDLDDTIRRLQAFAEAGADVLFAPGLPDLTAIQKVCAAVSKPVNVIGGSPGKPFTVANLTAAGVKRISLATSLYRTAMTGLRDAAEEVRTQGTFSYGNRAMPGTELGDFVS